MIWLWTWGGVCFGYRQDNELWTHAGKHVGRFYQDEVYGPNGDYLGELMEDDRLITDSSKINNRQIRFAPYANTIPHVKYIDYIGNVMYFGYQDFPDPESF